MRSSGFFIIARTSAALAGLPLLAAAAPPQMQVQVGDVGPLKQKAAPAPKLLHFQKSMFVAAPVPDRDASAPPDLAPAQAEVVPRLISPKTLFSGDGFSYASSEQSDARKAPGAGLGIQVPLDQH